MENNASLWYKKNEHKNKVFGHKSGPSGAFLTKMTWSCSS